MCRTERVSSTIDRDSMVCEPKMALTVHVDDLRQAMAVSGVARALEAPDVIEYWKSAPYLLNFMRDYALKRVMKEMEEPSLPLPWSTPWRRPRVPASTTVSSTLTRR